MTTDTVKDSAYYEEVANGHMVRAQNNVGLNVREVGLIYSNLAVAAAQLAVLKRMEELK